MSNHYIFENTPLHEAAAEREAMAKRIAVIERRGLPTSWRDATITPKLVCVYLGRFTFLYEVLTDKIGFELGLKESLFDGAVLSDDEKQFIDFENIYEIAVLEHHKLLFSGSEDV